jgi:hypothetical protein
MSWYYAEVLGPNGLNSEGQVPEKLLQNRKMIIPLVQNSAAVQRPTEMVRCFVSAVEGAVKSRQLSGQSNRSTCIAWLWFPGLYQLYKHFVCTELSGTRWDPTKLVFCFRCRFLGSSICLWKTEPIRSFSTCAVHHSFLLSLSRRNRFQYLGRVKRFLICRHLEKRQSWGRGKRINDLCADRSAQKVAVRLTRDTRVQREVSIRRWLPIALFLVLLHRVLCPTPWKKVLSAPSSFDVCGHAVCGCIFSTW